MNREELYYKTVNLLLDAYNNRELVHGACDRCAVGNICKEASSKLSISLYKWRHLFVTVLEDNKLKQYFFESNLYENEEAGRALVNYTGYTVEELARVEYAFESSIYNTEEGYNYYTKREPIKGQYIGLCAVLDVLKEIHETDEPESKERLESIYTELVEV